MNSPLNAALESPATRPVYWSVRREIWENRSIYIAPLIVAAVVLFGSLMSTIGLPRRMQGAATGSAAKQHAVTLPFQMTPAPIMLTTFLVGIVYCLDALYGERRDRSILFWKSLPVSDRTTVLAKAAVPLLVLPLIAYVLSVAALIILLVVSTAVVLGSGMNPVPLWAAAGFVPGLVIMLYGLTVHALWFSPIYAALLLISAWARRAPFLWVAVPLLAVAALEAMAFRTTYFLYFLRYRVVGAMTEAFVSLPPRSAGNFNRLEQLGPGKFLSSPGLWLGLLFAAACIAMAIRLRRNREPI